MAEAIRERLKTTCPRDCYDACGMVAVRDNGVVRKILGDPEHHVARGALCGKCAIAYNGVWRDAAARLTRPMRRSGPKGSGKFTPISWDEALAEIAGKLAPHIGGRPARQVVHAHYTGTVGLIAGWYPLRFFQAIGATEVDPDTVCNKAGHVALEMTFGDSLEGFDPESVKDAKTILVWGANPSHTAPHMHKNWLRETDATIVAIDPVAHGTARERAALHLQPRPGTDAALAFGLMHVALNKGLLDEDFIAAHVRGFEALLPDIEAADPETTSARTGVPADLIVKVGTAYAEGPSLLWMGQGMQRTARGGNAFRALSALVALTGNLGKPGAGFCYMNGPGSRGIDMDLLTPPALDIGCKSVSHMDLAATLADPSMAQIFFAWNCNPLASSPDQARLRGAMAREDLFTVVCDIFPTDTADFADIILPAASFLEFDDIVAPYFHHTLSAQVAVMEAPGEALPNQEIFRRLASAAGLSDPQLFEPDVTLLERILAMTPFDGDFASLAQAGTVQLFSEPRRQFEDLVFPTPSGKIELYSEAAIEAGLPAVPEPHADVPSDQGMLRILSPASAWQMNASYANDPGVVAKIGPNSVLLHPDEAARRGLSDGDPVVLANSAGELALRVSLSDIAQPGVGIVYKGRWPRQEASGANVNVLHAGRKSDIAEATAVHNIEVSIRRVDAAE
ncbi:molybdopterin-containing oxidoreductase family protein [Tropicimonas marinistellae]|uniref:molybdopterin-containing oxidoreductase family protein n=1 Tax=Tropicimonas marinistellae TaxID=1739787 RepID=UPI00082DEF66|nr:molybdopterin-dependent oxidoreductase [Tropicimonas marinistellae]